MQRLTLTLFAIAASTLVAEARAADPVPPATVVTVNGHGITVGDIEALLLARQIPEKLRPDLRKAFLERLIDDHLMREFLTGRKITAPRELLDRAVLKIHLQIRRQGGKPADVLRKRGLDDAKLRRQLSLPIAWNVYAREIIADMEIKQRFQRRRAEFDGTQIRASHIVLKPSQDDAAKRAALQKLDRLRADILSGRITFAEAAKKHSTSPSAKKGGDVGFFPIRGTMPLVIARQAFALKDKEISKPFLTQFGVHLVQVTERKPGQLSLEDVRPEIFQQIARERRRQTVTRLRKSAKIVRK